MTHYADEPAALRWPDEVEDRSKMVMPGDNVEMMCDTYNPLAIEPGLRFNVREGGRTVSYSSNLVFIHRIWKCKTYFRSLMPLNPYNESIVKY